MAYLDLDVETNKGDTDNGAKHGVPIPNMFFTHQMDEDMWFGFGITVPFGMRLNISATGNLPPTA